MIGKAEALKRIAVLYGETRKARGITTVSGRSRVQFPPGPPPSLGAKHL